MVLVIVDSVHNLMNVHGFWYSESVVRRCFPKMETPVLEFLFNTIEHFFYRTPLLAAFGYLTDV